MSDASKEYICIKRVSAEFMTRGDYNDYRGWKLPPNEDPDDAGYLVSDEGGYTTWVPLDEFQANYTLAGKDKLIDSILDMSASDYKKRFIAEYNQTRERYNRLHRMITRYEAGKLDFTPACELSMLKDQAGAMGNYLYALEVRALIEDIELDL